MKKVLSDTWCTEPPHDYELKKYQLLGAIQQIVKMVQSGELYNALIEVESNLYMMYKFQSNKNVLEDKMKILKGINLDTMSLEYEYPEESEEMEDIQKLCDYAIEEFEAVFKLVRSKWRTLSKKIVLTEIPSSRPTKKKGQVFVNDIESNSIIIYEYINMPEKEWRDLEFKKIGVIENEVGKLSEYIQNLEDSDNYRFWRCNHTIKHNLEDCVIPLIKYNLFFKIISA